MSTITQATPVDAVSTPVVFTDLQDIQVAYDKIHDRVTVTPNQMDKGATVRFHDPNGGKLRIVFLSPCGKEMDSVSDSEPYVLKIGGTYHFKCFFSPLEGTTETSPENGGIIDVVPQRP
ncbi:MAG TPA: hypothetical protein VNW97_04615 [Candidatus Saccharimonadales bacterium]|jgi:hypothetical protein|nr:hypothetical protein [Candidatus Saccharimonadales bacterium]